MERWLLFIVLAVHMGRARPGPLLSAYYEWQSDPSTPFDAFLVQRQMLSDADCQAVNEGLEHLISGSQDETGRILSVLARGEVPSGFLPETPMVDSDRETVKAAPDALSALGKASSRGVAEEAGRYSVRSEYARGGMGRVLLVHDQHIGRDIALKELLPEVGGPAAPADTPVRQSMPVIARFLQEARITGQLEHPSIVPVYELGHRADGSLYYTMKLVRGRTMASAIHDAQGLPGRLSLISHFTDLCNSIAYAHSRGVIHRDIKPGNVMVGEFGETVVLDWGLAKSKEQPDVHAPGLSESLHVLWSGEEDAFARTEYGQIMGTPHYMPPEQAEGDIENIDERSDVYSLGAVLYEILTGHPPFTGKTALEVVQHVLQDDPRSVSDYSPDAPPELVAICEKAMARDRSARYSTAKDLAEDMERFLTGALVQAHQYTLWDLLKRWAYRNKWILATAGAALIILIASTAYYNYMLIQRNIALEKARASEAEQRVIAEEARDVAQRNERAAKWQSYLSRIGHAKGLVDDRQFALAEEILWAIEPDFRNVEWGMLVARCNQDYQTLPNDTGSLNFARFGATDDHVVTTATDGRVAFWEVESGEQAAVHHIHQQPILSYVPDASGNYAATASYNIDGRAIVWDLEAFAPLYEFRNADYQMWRSVDLDMERGLLIAGGTGSTAWDLASESMLYRFESFGQASAVAILGEYGIFANGDLEGWVYISSIDTGEHIARFQNGSAAVMQLAHTPGLPWLIAVYKSGELAVWNAETRELTRVIDADLDSAGGAMLEGNPVAVDVDAAGNRVASLYREDQAAVWDLETGERVFESGLHGGAVSIVRFSPDGQRLLTGAVDKTARIWDIASGEEIAIFEGHSAEVSDVDFSDDGQTILTASLDGFSKLWSLPGYAAHRAQIHFDGHAGAIVDASFNGDGSVCVTFSTDRTAKVWNTSDGSLMATFGGTGLEATGGSISADGTSILVTSMENVPIVFDTSTGEVRHRLFGHSAQVLDGEYTSDGSRIVTAGWGGSIVVWDAATGESLTTFKAPVSSPRTCAVGNDDRLLAVGGADGIIRVWDLESETLLHEFEASDEEIASLDLDSTSATLVAGDGGGRISIWSLEPLEERLRFGGHTEAVTRVSFALGGERVASAGLDGWVKLWDPEEGREVYSVSMAERTVARALAWAPTGRGLVIGDSRGSAELRRSAPWRIDQIPDESGSHDLRTAYGRYKRDRRLKDPDYPGASGFHAAIAPDELERRLGILGEEGAAGDGTGWFVDGVRPVAAMEPLTLAAGDRVVSVAGEVIADGSDVLRALGNLDLAPDTEQTLAIEFERDGVEHAVNVNVTPRTVFERDLMIPRVMMDAILMAAIDTLRYEGQTIKDLQQGTFLYWEIPAKGNTFDGIWIALFETAGDSQDIRTEMVSRAMQSLGLHYRDRFYRGNGVIFNTTDKVLALAEEARQTLEEEGEYVWNLEILRGFFAKLDMRVEVR